MVDFRAGRQDVTSHAGLEFMRVDTSSSKDLGECRTNRYHLIWRRSWTGRLGGFSSGGCQYAGCLFLAGGA